LAKDTKEISPDEREFRSLLGRLENGVALNSDERLIFDRFVARVIARTPALLASITNAVGKRDF
jgi:hypothetical protein